MRQAGLFGLSDHLKRLSADGDPLEAEQRMARPVCKRISCGVLISLRQRIRSHEQAHGQDGNPRV
jgi:hypothetical protein